MIKITGIAVEDIPDLRTLEETVGDAWMGVWRASHPNIKREDTARKSLAGLFLLRLMGGEGKLIYPESGRPCFADSNLDFSISHADNAVFCALSSPEGDAVERIGLDAEEGSRLSDDRLPELAARWFSKGELDHFFTSPTRDTFLTLWTRKEAMVKREGRGLSALGEIDTLGAEETAALAFFSYVVNGTHLTLCADGGVLPPRAVEMRCFAKTIK